MRRLPIPEPRPRAPGEPDPPFTTGKPRWVSEGTLDAAYVSKWDATCFVCRRTIPAGEPHQYRTRCVYHACSGCPYPREAGNYQ